MYSTSNKYKVFAKIGHSQALYWGFTKVISWQLSGNLNLIDLDIYLNCSWIYNYYYSERILFTTIVHSSEKRCLRSTFWPREMLCLCTKKTQGLVSFFHFSTMSFYFAFIKWKTKLLEMKNEKNYLVFLFT